MAKSKTVASRWFEDVQVGDRLPELEVPITSTLIVAGAIASRDFQDVHHDMARAKEKGTRDIFMNILTTNGLVGRFVTDWAGRDAVVAAIAIKLGAPNFPGDTMAMTGQVSAREVLDGDGLVEVEVKGQNGLGEHVAGTVRVQLPRKDQR